MANVQNVTAGKPKVGGAISVAPLTATLPTDAETALTGFASLGYVSEDGLTQGVTRDSEAIKAWGGDTVMTTQTDFALTYQFTLIEVLNADVRKVVFGDDNVSGDLATGLTTLINSKELPAKAYVIDMILNGNLDRIVIPNGKVTEIGDTVFSDGEPVGFEVTITALPDQSGNCSYEYTIANGSGSL